MRQIIRTGLLGAAVGLGFAAAGLGITSLLTPPAKARSEGSRLKAIRPVDQMRCFPPGTLGVENFLACPDGLPDMKAT